MAKKDLKKEITDILNDKKFLNVVFVALILSFILLAISVVTNSRKKDTTEVVGSAEANGLESTEEGQEILSSYEEKEKKELKELLGKIDGVGDVEVMIYFKSGEVKVPAKEDTTQATITEETDNQGGKRTNKQNTDGTKVVMSDNGSKVEPYILQVNKPEISGVVVVATGATSSKVKYDIQVAVSNLYGIYVDKVNVYPMKN